MTFDSGERRGAVLNGFTIQNGAGQNGGGILCTSAAPTIMNNVITNNSARRGGGILCAAADALLANNIFTGNSADFGAGISCGASSPTITNNTIVNNSARYWGGGIHCVNSSPAITNSILWANEAGTGAQIDIRGGSDPVVMYCDIQGGWVGGGNIDGDPLLSDPTAYDFHLTYGSPCIDTGTDSDLAEDFEDDPRPIDGDFDGTAGFDMGADEYNPAGMDSDGDGLTDAYEASIGTNPSEEDTDGDGLVDYAEVYWDGSGEYDPYDPVTNPAGKDTDANESDTDEDGHSDYIEFYFGSDPTDENVTPHIIKMNFQPAWSTPPPDYCPVGAELYAPRGYGWR